MQTSCHAPVERFLLALILIMFVTGTACSFPQFLASKEAQSPAQPLDQTTAPEPVVEAVQAEGNPNAANAEPAGADADEADEVFIREADFQPAVSTFSPLGSIAFNVKPDVSVERSIASDDPQVEMQLEDPAGLTWTLSIPAGALQSEQTIRMVPLTGVQSSEIQGLAGGILLEPDGLEFLLPVRLSVSGPGLANNALILSGAHTGANVDYAMQDQDAALPTAQLLHFSTYFVTTPEIGQMNQQANQAYLQAVKEAQGLLKSPVEVPEPPSIPLECPDAKTGEKNGQQLKDFMARALAPEEAMLTRLLTLRTAIASTSVNNLEPLGSVEGKLMNRLRQKATKMMSTYRDKDEKLIAVSEFTMEVARKLQLFGVFPETSQGILNELAQWNKQLVDKLLKDIRSNHNYKKIPVVMLIAYRAQLLGANLEVGEFLDKLKAALAFEVQITYQYTLPDVYIDTKSTVPVQFEPQNMGMLSCSGQGSGMYTRAEVNDPMVTYEPSNYTVQVIVKDFDPCEGTVTIGFDRLGSSSEVMTVTDEDVSQTFNLTLAQDAVSALYGDYLKEGMLMFPMTLNNGSPTAAEETFSQEKYGKVFGELQITFTHKPK